MFQQVKEHFNKKIDEIRKSGLYKDERLICSPQNGKVAVKLTTNDLPQTIINLCSNNYLGLSNHPEVLQAAHDGIEERGLGMSSVRFICGTLDTHKELENKVSHFLGMEDTILFTSCFDANAALFETILTKEDAIFSDRLVHASIIDGIRLCKAQKFIYNHSDMRDLENGLKESKAKTKLIITDGVFSMDGDMAPLDQICQLAEKYRALVAIDDSHATGFIGKTGRGVHEYFKVQDKVDIITTTFGKALGGATGGCISAHHEIVELLRQRARPYLFSNSLMPAVVSSTIKILDLISYSTQRRDHLEKLTKFWRNSLKEAGFEIKEGNTPIIPIMLYEANLAQEFSRRLYQEGIFAVGFFYPVVPAQEARIRTQLSSSHSLSDLEFALQKFISIGQSLKII